MHGAAGRPEAHGDPQSQTGRDADGRGPTVPDEVAPDATVPGEAASGGATSDGFVPDEAAPGAAATGGSVPDGAAPDAVVRGAAAPPLSAEEERIARYGRWPVGAMWCMIASLAPVVVGLALGAVLWSDPGTGEEGFIPFFILHFGRFPAILAAALAWVLFAREPKGSSRRGRARAFAIIASVYPALGLLYMLRLV